MIGGLISDGISFTQNTSSLYVPADVNFSIRHIGKIRNRHIVDFIAIG